MLVSAVRVVIRVQGGDGIICIEMYKYMESCINKGAKISVNGNYLTEGSGFSSIMEVSEDNAYMPDFVEDDMGRVIEVRFDKVIRKY